MRFRQFIAVTWLGLVCSITPAHADKRVALVIGNGAYHHADRLSNPVNDARGMRDALSRLKFDVVYGEDLDLRALNIKIGEFEGRAVGTDVALVYFAGHGATFGDAPYVVPVDAEFTSLDTAPRELIAVEELIGGLRRAKNVRIAILDACRDNAAERALKASRGTPTRGLAPPKNPSGLIIAYATQHGATAADSAGSANSPFTAALLHNIATPGLDVKDMFFKVGSEVDADTNGRQQPEISVSMFGRYVLVPAEIKPEPAPRPAPPVSAGNAQPTAVALPTNEEVVVSKIYGLKVSNMTNELREKYKIKDSLKGVVITYVDAGSQAEEYLKVGDVVLDVGPAAIANVDDFQKQLDQERRSVLLRVANAKGQQVHFVVLSLQ